MSAGTLNPQQLRSLVEDKWQRDEHAPAVGFHVVNDPAFPAEVEFEFGKAKVIRADTVFQIREALLDAERSKGRIILLTKLQQGDLGHDVVGRLARSKLFPINPWANLCSLFKAKELDRSVCDAVLAQALLESAPPDGYPPVSAGILDAGTVWRAVCRHVFDMGEREPDRVTLLLWATNKAKTSRYLTASDGLRAALRQRLVGTLLEPADSILRFLDSGAGAEALALAVACQVVFGDGQAPVLDAAAARMEQYHGNKPIPPHVGQALGRIAGEAIADLDRTDDSKLAQQHLQRADELLLQFRCNEQAYRSGLTRLSYEQRLARFGEAIVAAPASQPAIADCEQRQVEITEHRRAKLGQRVEQVSRTEMAVRLVRWLSSPTPSPPAFAEKVSVYRRELAFVDWARESICRGEDVAELTKAYRQLDQAVLERREGFNREFADELVNWISVGSSTDGVLGVEDVLASVVAKVAAANNRVLLIVLDGMSWAVCHELLEDIRNEHWFEATLDESSALPSPVIATVPSETAFSRASLLSGLLTRGDSAVERKNFASHPALRSVGDKRYPPVLFHKKEATEGARGGVGEDLSKAILSATTRVVGVVINAIDDRLSSAQQIRDDWTINRISLLGPILKLARDSGRVVILASDHGHVWHRPDARLAAGDAGTRWRSHSGDVEQGEIAVTGKRVRDEGGQDSVISTWSETLYYLKQQNGYHGGATPQEMICPLVILTDKTSTYSGLFPCEYPKPEWWSSAPVASVMAPEPDVPVIVLGPKRPATLFDHLQDDEPKGTTEQKPATAAAPQATAAWVERLLGSQAYKDQKDFVRRHAPDDETVRRCLVALDSGGGILTPVAFCKVTEIPAGRLDGLMARIQRLLNVDGYEVLVFSRAENRIELNVAKLKRQFDLE